MNTILVTGGGGFLGSALVSLLLARGYQVQVLARGSYPHLAAMGMRLFTGSITDLTFARKAVRGCQMVYHVAAKAGDGLIYKDFFRANVLGTATILQACRLEAVPGLVYTSSPSVVTDSSFFHTLRQPQALAGIDESYPYPAKYTAAYPETKAHAEKLVLQANCSQLRTVSLRPHLIRGPGDTQLTARILARARSGQLRLVGNGNNLIATTYIEDAARAQVLAGERLTSGEPSCAGKAYFITSNDPQPLKVLVGKILVAAGFAPDLESIPFPLAYALGGILESAWRTLGRDDEPLMTRFTAQQLARSHWFDLSAAKRDLGYEPQISVDEGMRRLQQWFADSH